MKEKEEKEKELQDSTEIKQKKNAVKDAIDEVRKAEALVKEDMSKGKTAANDSDMQSETSRLENLVKKALIEVQKGQEKQEMKIEKMLAEKHVMSIT
jgi:hypothetical protein